jgi:hypothetical protein
MRPAVLLLAAFLATGLYRPALAQAERAPGVQPLDQILSEVRRTHPGQFFDADGPTPGPGGSEHYHLKWMTPDGRIEWLDTDARTGRVLGSSPGRDTFDAPGQQHNFAPAPSYPAPQTYEREPRGGGFENRGGYEGRGRGGYGNRGDFGDRGGFGNRGGFEDRGGGRGRHGR